MDCALLEPHTRSCEILRSNVNPYDPKSLHRVKGDAQSEYARVIRAVAGTLADFDPGKEFAPYGFGAKLPPSQTICADCFSLVGDWFDPKVLGVEAVLKAYERALHVVHLHGPTRLSKLIKTGLQYAECYKEATDELKTFRTQMRYTVLIASTLDTLDEQPSRGSKPHAIPQSRNLATSEREREREKKSVAS
eukprot:2034330-Amphidinium_carterae.1